MEEEELATQGVCVYRELERPVQVCGRGGRRVRGERHVCARVHAGESACVHVRYQNPRQTNQRGD